jgi:hypothetical protein
VTAKVSWLTRVSKPSSHLNVPLFDDGASIATSDMEIIEGKARWIHCTPLTGSDGNVGVIMIIMVDKSDSLNSLPNIPTMRSATGVTIGPVPPHARARSHNSFRSLDHTPERWQPRSSPASVTNTATPSRVGSINNPPLRSIGVSKLYADYMKEVRESQRPDSSISSQTQDSEDPMRGLGTVATAVSVQAVNGRGRTKKIGGTF